MKGITKDTILANLLVIPMCLHWLLPVTIENLLYVNIGGLVYFLPDLCYVLYLLCYVGYKNKSYSINNKIKTNIIILSAILFLYTTLHIYLVLGHYNIHKIINLIINNYSFVYFPVIFICFPLNNRQVECTKILIIISALIIAFQFIIYGTGILSYTTAVGDQLSNISEGYGNFYRVSTTIGAATGSALILSLCGIIIVEFYNIKIKYKILIIVIISIGVLLSMSRGGILLWFIFLLLYIHKTYIRNKSYKKKIISYIFVLVFIYILHYLNLFNTFVTRLDMVENVSSGRFDLYEDAINLIKKSGYMGVGIGQMFPEKSLHNYMSVDYIACHNTYLTYIAELGIIGFIFIIIMYICILKKINYNFSASKALIIFMLVNMNTEGIIVMSEYLSLFFFLIMIILQKINTNREIILINQQNKYCKVVYNT